MSLLQLPQALLGPQHRVVGLVGVEEDRAALPVVPDHLAVLESHRRPHVLLRLLAQVAQFRP
jgi:hypothetical protein